MRLRTCLGSILQLINTTKEYIKMSPKAYFSKLTIMKIQLTKWEIMLYHRTYSIHLVASDQRTQLIIGVVSCYHQHKSIGNMSILSWSKHSNGITVNKLISHNHCKCRHDNLQQQSNLLHNQRGNIEGTTEGVEQTLQLHALLMLVQVRHLKSSHRLNKEMTLQCYYTAQLDKYLLKVLPRLSEPLMVSTTKVNGQAMSIRCFWRDSQSSARIGTRSRSTLKLGLAHRRGHTPRSFSESLKNMATSME